MGRKPSPTRSKPKNPRARRRSPSPESDSDLEDLAGVRDACLKQYGKSENTRKAYAGHIARGKKWIASQVAKAQRKGVDSWEEIPLSALKVVFETPPSRYTAKALQLHLVHRCFREHRSKSTAEGVQGAFAEYWDTM